MAERTPSRCGMKKPKKTPKPVEQLPPQQGLEVVQNMMELPPLPPMEDAILQEILLAPLHTHFVVPNKGKKASCPVFFGPVEEKNLVVELICDQINQQTFQQWGTLACYCGVVPRLKLSKTSTNPNRLFVCCPKPQEMKCQFFQWIDKPPLPKKTCNATAIKKRFLEMAEETVTKRGKEDMEDGFAFAPDVYGNKVNNVLEGM